MPKRAYPQEYIQKGLKGSSYTLPAHEGGGQIKVLLFQKAFFIVKTASKEQPKQHHISWMKYGGIKAAWDKVCNDAGIPLDPM